MTKWTNKQMNEWMNEASNQVIKQTTNERMNEWIDKLINAGIGCFIISVKSRQYANLWTHNGLNKTTYEQKWN